MTSEADRADDLTGRLNQADRGDRELMAYVQAEMERLARRALRQGARGATLCTGAVVNEAYLRLFGEHQKRFRDRGHFLATAATAMRHVLVDYARARLAVKRGSGGVLEPLDLSGRNDIAIDAEAEQLIGIDRAVDALDKLDSRARQVFELRFFAGLEVEDVAVAMAISEATVKRDARFAKAFIAEQLEWGAES